MNFTQGQQKLLLYWGEIVSSVFQRASTAEVWDVVRNAATREGVDLSGVRLTDMNALRSIATRQRNSQSVLNSARPGTLLDASMIGTDVSARPADVQLMSQKYVLRFQHDVTIDGQLQTFWRSSTIDGSPGVTVDDLRQRAEQDAEALADDYGVTHVGIGLMQLVAV